jgi:CheY-like chemotaxis protein
VLGEGTTFTLRFKATMTKVEAKVGEVPVEPVKGRRILVVDDNAAVLRTMQVQLEGLGQLVWTAESADAALKVLEEHGPFDIVFTDLGMPGTNGWELAEAIKARAPYTQVVLVTGWGEQALQAETRRRVFVERVLFKPVRQRVFGETISALTSSRGV